MLIYWKKYPTTIPPTARPANPMYIITFEVRLEFCTAFSGMLFAGTLFAGMLLASMLFVGMLPLVNMFVGKCPKTSKYLGETIAITINGVAILRLNSVCSHICSHHN